MTRAFRNRAAAAIAVGLLVLLAPLAVRADSISPATYTASGPTGATYTVNKTVTVNAGTPTTSKVDVFFLADTTGSMGSSIAAVKTAAGSILSSTAGLGDVQFGVGEYRDVGDTFVYRTNTALTSSQATAQAGINVWAAGGGGDYAEAGLFALASVANTTAWRPGSARILVWFGDAPGHDPSGPSGVTEAGATAALQAKGINVQAINVAPLSWDFEPPSGPGLYGLNDAGQAGRIATATGGTLYSGIDSSSIVDTIKAAITSVFTTYSSVCLGSTDVPAGVAVSWTPCYTGAFDRKEDRTFGFTVTMTDREVGTHTFHIDALVDGGIVATETDSITSTIPEPGTLILLGSGIVGLLARRRRAA